MSSLNAYDKSSRSANQSIMNIVPYFQSLWSTSPSPKDAHDRDQVIWGGFDYFENENGRQLCLLLAYPNGFQIWNLEGSTFEEITSSKKDGSIKCLKFLSEAAPSSNNTIDVLQEHRPVVAVVSGEDDPKFPRSSVKLYSLKNQDYLKKLLRFKSDVYNVTSCPHAFVVVLKEELYGFDPRSLEKVFVLSTYSSPSPFGVFSVGGRWLAYPATVPPPSNNNSPISSPSSSYSTSPNLLGVAKDVASTTFSGLFYLGEAGRKKMSNYLYQNDSPENPEKEAGGTVAVYDVVDKSLISHFRAHAQPLYLLQFDPSGTLLVTVSVDGHNFNVFQICPTSDNPNKSYHHLYKLSRGYTDAAIQSISFNSNSHWLAAQSSRGTVHLFALRLGGGNVSRHSHVEQKKENQDIYQFQHFSKKNTQLEPHIRLTARNRIKQLSSTEDPQQGGAGCSTFVNKGKETVVYTLSQQGKLLQTQLVPHTSHAPDGDPNELLLTLKQIGEANLARKIGTSEFSKSPSTFKKNNLSKNGSTDESKWIPNVELSSTNYFKPLWRNPSFSIKAFEFKDPNNKYLFDSELLSENIIVTKIYEPTHHRNSLNLIRDDSSSPMSMSVPVPIYSGYNSQSLPNSCPSPSPPSAFSSSVREPHSLGHSPSISPSAPSLCSSDPDPVSPALNSHRKEIHSQKQDNDGEMFTFSPEDTQVDLEDQGHPIVYAQFRVEEDEDEEDARNPTFVYSAPDHP